MASIETVFYSMNTGFRLLFSEKSENLGVNCERYSYGRAIGASLMNSVLRYWTLLLVCVGVSGALAEPEDAELGDAVVRARGILLVDETIEPVMTVRWMTGDGERVVSGAMAYGPPTGGVVLEGDVEGEAGNVRAYLALGGSRLDTGAGHPKGIVIRAGLTKVESSKPFFEDVEAGTSVEIEIRGVVLSEPVRFHAGTGIMHLKYAIGDLEACSLPGTARNQYLLSDPKDTLGGRVVAGVNATPGALAGLDEDGGSFEIEIDEDEMSMGYVVRVPYGLLRHLQDPWDSTLPGTFFEPIHLHAEAELIPVWATPLEREWIVESNEPAVEAVEEGSDGDPSSGG